MSKGKSPKVKAPTGRLRFADDARATVGPKKLKPYDRKFHDGWYEVVSRFNGGDRVKNIPEVEGHRVFLMGAIDGVVIVEVPPDMSRQARDALGVALSERVRGNVLLVDEHIQFMQLRRASPQEEVRLHAAAKAQAEDTKAAPPDPAHDAGPRPLAASDGDRGDRLEGESAPSRDGGHDEPPRSGEVQHDP